MLTVGEAGRRGEESLGIRLRGSSPLLPIFRKSALCAQTRPSPNQVYTLRIEKEEQRTLELRLVGVEENLDFVV